MPIPTFFGQNQIFGGGAPSFPDFPSITSEWARWEPFRETGYSDGDGIEPLTDWSGNGRDWTTTVADIARPQYKENVLNGLAVADADAPGGAGGWDTGPDMSGLTGVHALIIIKAKTDPAADIGETVLWNVGTDALAAHVPYTDGLLYDDAFSTTRRTANPAISLSSTFVLYEIVSTSSEWTSTLIHPNGTTETLITTGTNTVAAPAAPLLMTVSRHKMAAFYIFSAKLSSGDRTSVIDYLNDPAIFNTSFS